MKPQQVRSTPDLKHCILSCIAIIRKEIFFVTLLRSSKYMAHMFTRIAFEQVVFAQ
jgi:hypothetical protein